MLATEAGLGNGETPIFPIQIFKVKEGVSYNPGDPELRPVQAGLQGIVPRDCSLTSRSWMRRFNKQYYGGRRSEHRSAHTWDAAPES